MGLSPVNVPQCGNLLRESVVAQEQIRIKIEMENHGARRQSSAEPRILLNARSRL
jgi:hypothetical protein